jgi:hypothetical protein
MIFIPKNFKNILFAFLGLSFLVSCASESQILFATPPAKYKKLGQVSGTAIGSLGAVYTAYYVIPIGLNSRTQRAYLDALTKIPGTTSLINVTYKEDWYWWLIGTARKVTISGEAIKEVR